MAAERKEIIAKIQHAWINDNCTGSLASLERAYDAGYRRGIEDAAKKAKSNDICACGEVIATAIRSLADTKEG